MQFTYQYKGNSQVASDVNQSSVSFAPDSLRKPTFFVATLKQGLAFREAISALHQVVVCDMRFQPRDKSDYEQWLAQMQEQLLAEFISKGTQAKDKLERVKHELSQLNKQSSELLAPYYKAQSKYFNYLYQHDMDAWWVLDPVITVNPDEVFFECFSEDESSYGKLSCRYEVFEKITDFECGTTNIDYSQGLYEQFQQIRDYKKTQLIIDPDGFKVQTADGDSFEEKKIDLPDSWIRGFLQVSSAMTMPMVAIDLQPMDIHNICQMLRRHKERVGPRSMRFVLTPGHRVKIIFEPWGYELICRRSIYQGSTEQTVRVWGRRRIHILERLIPLADKFTLHLLGDGMPSFYIADLGDLSFTLGLSGWSANDWSKMANFDLMAARSEVDDITASSIYQALLSKWVASAEQLSKATGFDRVTVTTALAKYAQHGQVLYDLSQGLYRIRELSREPLDMSVLRFSNEREALAQRFVDAQLATLQTPSEYNGGISLHGEVLDNAVCYQSTLTIDSDFRISAASCHCHFYHQNKLRKGPCEHMIALRLLFNQSVKANKNNGIDR
jgi:hypothetical protein